MTDILEANKRDLTGQASSFVVTDMTADYALDCDSDADNAIADVLGTLIQELIRRGIIHGTIATH